MTKKTTEYVILSKNPESQWLKLTITMVYDVITMSSTQTRSKPCLVTAANPTEIQE